MAGQQGEPWQRPLPPPVDGFGPTEFSRRRAALRKRLAGGIIVIRGSSADEFHETGHRFRQNSDFFYMTGVDTPGAYLVMLPPGLNPRIGGRDWPVKARDLLFLPARDPRTETWDGPGIGPGDEAAARAGVDTAVDSSAFTAALTQWARHCPVVYMPLPYGRAARFTREAGLVEEIRALAPATVISDAATAIARIRMAKSRAELSRIADAVTITGHGQSAARKVIACGAGRHEFDVEAAILAEFRSHGARAGFECIVGSGLNGTVLHYDRNDAEMETGQMVVIDIGARIGNYTGDITRTYPVGGRFGRRERAIYDLVLGSMEHVVASFRCGKDTTRTLRDRCREYLKQSKLTGVAPDGTKATMDTFMPHGISHHLGLDVHDLIATIDMDEPLDVGAVVTIEPGVYLPREGLGCRIEDDYLVTRDGLKVIGEPLAKDPAEIERLMAGDRAAA